MIEFTVFVDRNTETTKKMPVFPSFFVVGIVLLVATLMGCGATYPDSDEFKEHYRAFKNYYYSTNFTYRLDNGKPVIESGTQSNLLFFFVDQRDDIYLPRDVDSEFEVELKKYDSRWFLRLENPSNTNHFIFSNTDFGDGVSFHHYTLEGELINFTNGYLFITQADNLHWHVNAEIKIDSTNYTSSGRHRLSEYDVATETFIPID